MDKEIKKDFEQKLINEFPSFFVDMYGNPRVTCLYLGLEIGKGWYDLIYKLCQDIKKTNYPDTFKFVQIKEKFGGLRAYCYGATKEISELIEKAEDESYKICEKCGSTGDVTSEGAWISTLCKSCRSQK